VNRIRLFIVDDHQLLLEGTKAALEKYPDIEITGLATTGLDALRDIEQAAPDLVLLDVRLPDISGIEVARHIRERWPSMLIIALSGFDDSMYVKGLRKLGVLACLPKTMKTAELIEAIRDACAGKTPAAQPNRGSPELLDPLTPREFQVLELMGKGSRNSEIASALGLSIKAVEYHVTHVLEKLDARSRSEAIIKAARILDVPLSGETPPSR